MTDADLDQAIVTLLTATGLDYPDARNALRDVRQFVPNKEEE